MDLLLLGSNLGLGHATVEITKTRRALPALQDGRPFPLGARGLIPVESIRKSGAVKVAYALPLGDPGTEWESGYASQAAFDDDGQPYESISLAAPRPSASTGDAYDSDDGSPAPLMDPDEAYDLLLDAVYAINDMLDEAVELTGHQFGIVDAVRIGVPSRGAGYTRVLLRPRGDDGPSPTPVHLVVETSIDPGSPGSLTSIVRYDRSGHISTMLLTEYGEAGYWCRIEASVNYRSHRLAVYKVEERDGRHPDGRLLYKRGYGQWDGLD